MVEAEAVPDLTKRQIEAIADGRLTLRKLYEQKGWKKSKGLM